MTDGKKFYNIDSRMENIFGQLEQIPEQWKVYEIKFMEMSDWMDTVEKSLDNVNKGMTSRDGFLREKQIFQVRKSCKTFLFYLLLLKLPNMLEHSEIV